MISRGIYIICFILFGLFYNVLAQDCEKSKVYKQCEFPEKSGFENKLNWNKSFKKGQTKQYVLTFIKGKKYYISVCSKEVDTDIHIKLKEDNEKQELLYDNALNELSKVLELQLEETKKMIIEVSVPPNKINESKKLYTCIGLRMFFKSAK